MMYLDKMVCCLKANGKILREFKDTAYIPFGAEYSILIKNLHTQRALVTIYIDGENQTPTGLVLDAGKEVDFERSLKNGSLTEGNKFKFIERTGAVEEHRGVKLEDGIVRIEFQYEQPQMRVSDLPGWERDELMRSINTYGISGASGSTGSALRGASGSSGATYDVGGQPRRVDTSLNGAAMQQSATFQTQSYLDKNNIKVTSTSCHDGMATMDSNITTMSYNDAGITVAGSKSTQKFSTTYMGALETEKHSIVLKLLGETPDNKPVLQPVTVDKKQKCDTCGKVNKMNSKYCVECGTHLEIFA